MLLVEGREMQSAGPIIRRIMLALGRFAVELVGEFAGQFLVGIAFLVVLGIIAVIFATIFGLSPVELFRALTYGFFGK
jgi:hypothetical protein